jgi:predicted SAM-dependent methyltransferase
MGGSQPKSDHANMPHRLHWGCGPITPFGWVNSDIEPHAGVEVVADIRGGLPLPNAYFDYIVSIHALPELPYSDLDQALSELHRLLKPGGTLRLGLPDMDKAIRAYQAADLDYFLIGDDVVRTPAGKMIVQLTWFGRSRSLFTAEFIRELLERNGFVDVRSCVFHQTASRHAGIVELDDRPLESLFVEASKALPQ